MTQKQKPYTIHFVCRGNTYRSRLAAAYMDTLADARFVITSSGIEATASLVKTAQPYTKATAKLHKLSYGIADRTTQTTAALLQAADVVVFMNKDVYDDARKVYDFDIRKCLVWHVADMSDAHKAASLVLHSQQALVDAAAATFATIRKHCIDLYKYLTSTAWVDVTDKHNQLTGMRLPIAWAYDRGLWHRGVHVVVRTSDGKFVVGKRVKSIVIAPGMLEISLGGGIDSGETAARAAQRETHEELGVHLAEKAFRPLFMHRHVSYHPRYHKQGRVHLYVYAATLPVHSSQLLRPQPSEVEALRLLTPWQVRRLLQTHRMKHFGRLKWSYKLYSKAVAYSLLPA
jgi:protein-tyrosine-phosphatase/8-oxo-dGTP pyrophosphatase MutT (NUDIX family)